MTDKEALSWVNAMRLDNNDSTNCAADLCVHDIEAYGLKDWILIDEIDSQQAGEVLIDELLESEQERIDTLYESKKIALASTKMMNVLTKYHSIHEFIKAQIDEQDNTY